MEIGISFIAATLSLTLIFIFGWYSYKAEPVIQIPDISRFPFNEATGKERSFVNKTGDSSMWIESTRRTAIAKAYRPDWCCGAKPIKETQHTTGSTSGVSGLVLRSETYKGNSAYDWINIWSFRTGVAERNL